VAIARPAVRTIVLWDAVFVALAALQGLAFIAAPSIALIAAGIWWNSNTIAHNFIHRSFFRTRALTNLFSAYLSVLLGIPQSLWRARHLAHHAGTRPKLIVSTQLLAEVIVIVLLWMTLLNASPAFFLTIYLPGYALGLLLCGVQGYYEHAGGTTSHYGTVYNALLFNDGYHAEHHARPRAHWTELRARGAPRARSSRWPPLVRFLDDLNLETLERLVLRSPLLQRLVLSAHRGAFERLLTHVPVTRRIAIVGGGLFPRSALLLRELRPGAQLLIVDESAANIEVAHRLLGEGASYECRRFPSSALDLRDVDLLVIPLSYRGGREVLYRRPPAAAVFVHDWIWRPRGTSVVVSLFFLKRLNLVRP
jgi:hypothetical protein